MKIYYLHNGTEQDGPFDVSELKSKNITRKTEVWYEGLSDWKNAEEIDELKSLFSQTKAPPIKPKKTEQKTTQNKPKKKSFGKKILKPILTIIGILGVLFVANMIMENNSNSNPNYYQQKMTIEQTEKSDPLRFLSVTGKYNESFWGTEFKLKGEITNKATVANYKDIVVRITYFSKTKSVIGTKDYTIYEIFPSNRVKSFKLDVKNYNDVKSIGLKIIRATPK